MIASYAFCATVDAIGLIEIEQNIPFLAALPLSPPFSENPDLNI
jgi:hypothetical protein